MKKFEINPDDVEAFIIGRIAFNPDDVHYVKTFTDARAGLLRELSSINYILDAKYNLPRERGKSKHSINAEDMNDKRKKKTYATIEAWYRESGHLLAATGEKIYITKIALATGLHYLTVRNFLLSRGERLGLEKPYITKNVIEVLEKIFASEC